MLFRIELPIPIIHHQWNSVILDGNLCWVLPFFVFPHLPTILEIPNSEIRKLHSKSTRTSFTKKFMAFINVVLLLCSVSNKEIRSMEKCSLLLVSLNRNGFFTSLYYHYIFNLLNSCLSFFLLFLSTKPSFGCLKQKTQHKTALWVANGNNVSMCTISNKIQCQVELIPLIAVSRHCPRFSPIFSRSANMYTFELRQSLFTICSLSMEYKSEESDMDKFKYTKSSMVKFVWEERVQIVFDINFQFDYGFGIDVQTRIGEKCSPRGIHLRRGTCAILTRSLPFAHQYQFIKRCTMMPPPIDEVVSCTEKNLDRSGKKCSISY